MINEEHLKKKGWTRQEIDEAKEILSRAEEKKKKHIKLLDKTLYWLMFIVLVGIYLSYAFILRIIGIFLDPISVYLLSVLSGFIIGVFMISSIENIHWFTAKHHIAAMIIEPLLAVASFLLVFMRTEGWLVRDNLITRENAVIAVLLFIISSMLPNIFHFIRWMKRKI